MAIHHKLASGYSYFLTTTVVDWVDLFSRPVYKHLMLDSLYYCLANKDAERYSQQLFQILTRFF